MLDNTWELTGLFPSNWESRSLALAPDETTLFVGGWFSGNSGRESYITKVTLSPEGTPGTPETFTLPNRAAAAIAAASAINYFLDMMMKSCYFRNLISVLFLIYVKDIMDLVKMS